MNLRMKNDCVFSRCRAYRYLLTHRLDGDLFANRQGAVVWLLLNPSTAAEAVLDPTLRRVRTFTRRWGYSAFVILNLFGFRSTQPAVMKRAADPVGAENDEWILRATHNAEMVIAGWGRDGAFMGRDRAVRAMLGKKLHCLERNDDGSPKHPLYIAGAATPKLYTPRFTEDEC